MLEKPWNSTDLDQKNPGILLGTQPRNSGSCSSQKHPLHLGGNRKVRKHSWDFLEVFSLFFAIPGWIFPLFWLLGWGDLGILGFLELDFWEKGGASMDLGWENPDLGKAREGFGSEGNFWKSFPFFSTSFPKFGDFIHGKTWIGNPGSKSCLNPVFSQFFFPNSLFSAQLFLGLSSGMPEFLRIYSQTLHFRGINPKTWAKSWIFGEFLSIFASLWSCFIPAAPIAFSSCFSHFFLEKNPPRSQELQQRWEKLQNPGNSFNFSPKKPGFVWGAFPKKKKRDFEAFPWINLFLIFFGASQASGSAVPGGKEDF